MPRRILQGVVVSRKNNQTATVLVERRIRHPLYKKFIRRTKRFAAHDPQNQSSVGDSVRIIECPPVSKTKRWMLLRDQKEGATS